MGYKRGDIVLVNFNPQKKKDEVGKVRPAIIMSDTELNDVLDLVSVIALTTNIIKDSEPLRIHIKKRDALKINSDAMVEQLRSVSKERVGDKIASINQNEMAKIENGVGLMLGLCMIGENK